MTQSNKLTIQERTFRTVTVNEHYLARLANPYTYLPTALGEPYAH